MSNIGAIGKVITYRSHLSRLGDTNEQGTPFNGDINHVPGYGQLIQGTDLGESSSEEADEDDDSDTVVPGTPTSGVHAPSLGLSSFSTCERQDNAKFASGSTKSLDIENAILDLISRTSSGKCESILSDVLVSEGEEFIIEMIEHERKIGYRYADRDLASTDDKHYTMGEIEGLINNAEHTADAFRVAAQLVNFLEKGKGISNNTIEKITNCIQGTIMRLVQMKSINKHPVIVLVELMTKFALIGQLVRGDKIPACAVAGQVNILIEHRLNHFSRLSVLLMLLEFAGPKILRTETFEKLKHSVGQPEKVPGNSTSGVEKLNKMVKEVVSRLMDERGHTETRTVSDVQ